ncbi:MAG: hypothetical protein AAF356_02895 [Planctomycetota bacterium]
MRARRRAGGVVLLALAGPLPACTYERIVRYEPFLGDVPGAVVGSDATIGEQRPAPTAGPSARGPGDPLAVPLTGLRVEDEEGNITLRARSFQHLMHHIATTLAQGERDLFVEQVFSPLTLDEFYERELDPGIGFDELKRRERDVRALFTRMPLAERSPGVTLKKIDRNIYRLRVSGPNGAGLNWRSMDAHFAGGEWRLRWFGP